MTGVDGERLRAVGRGLEEVSKWSVTHDLDEVRPSFEQVGHDRVAGWLTANPQVWADTLSRLADTIRQAGGRLSDAAAVYEQCVSAWSPGQTPRAPSTTASTVSPIPTRRARAHPSEPGRRAGPSRADAASCSGAIVSGDK